MRVFEVLHRHLEHFLLLCSWLVFLLESSCKKSSLFFMLLLRSEALAPVEEGEAELESLISSVH